MATSGNRRRYLRSRSWLHRSLSFVAVMLAPATVACVESRTIPAISPVGVCAKINAAVANARHSTFLMIFPSGDRCGDIISPPDARLARDGTGSRFEVYGGGV